MADRYDLRLPCIRLMQGERALYSFAVDGKRLGDFAAVARVGRDDAGLQGYQRPEVLKHIRGIQRYLEKPGALLPNAIVVAFDDSVRFEAIDADSSDVTYAAMGILVIPVDESQDDGHKPGWIVDGQQRTAAIRESELDEFPVCVVSFVANEEEQRAQFILVNNTRPLPKGLIHELLPATQDELPLPLMRRRLAAEVVYRLNVDPDSPFHEMIATPTQPKGIIKDNAVLRMVENSVYNGALYAYRYADTGEGDVGSMVSHLKTFWSTVEATFPDAWKLPPRYSRLTHGAGIAALGYVMDRLTEGVPLADVGQASSKVSKLVGAAWTSGEWTFPTGPRRWNQIQNTPNDIRLLTDFLVSRLSA
ncbi:DGQHR domain-containing protein DpdB [Geodermatophilus sp. FMUSA9-8]|uniref:DGQHR domain-containing protein DpdB n=1 Tax=Geodermatophilus sp. FMUSA9-8 TaxID=3120155 RepID=UPI00300A6970